MDEEEEGGTVGVDAISGFRIGDREGAGQGVTAGSVWADCEEGRRLWIPFVFFSQDPIGVSIMPVCEIYTPTPQIWMCKRSVQSVCPIKLHFTYSWSVQKSLSCHPPSGIHWNFEVLLLWPEVYNVCFSLPTHPQGDCTDDGFSLSPLCSHLKKVEEKNPIQQLMKVRPGLT